MISVAPRTAIGSCEIKMMVRPLINLLKGPSTFFSDSASSLF